MGKAEELRKKAAKKGARRTQIIEVDGAQYEVREPDGKRAREIYEKARAGDKDERLDNDAFRVWAVVCCTYVPGTDELVWGGTDEEKKAHFEEISGWSWRAFRVFSEPVMEALGVRTEDEGKG